MKLVKKQEELTIAIPKGFLHKGAHEYLIGCGIDFENSDTDSDRELVFYDSKNNVKGILVRPNDVSVYVEHGCADLGIVGLDLLNEQLSEVVRVKDLGFGKCKLVVAVKKESGYKKISDLPPNSKIATKFLRLANDFIVKSGISAEVVKLYGSIELAPIVGLSDAIIDLVATGKTLKANNLVSIQTLLESSAILIANPVSFKLKKSFLDGIFFD